MKSARHLRRSDYRRAAISQRHQVRQRDWLAELLQPRRGCDHPARRRQPRHAAGGGTECQLGHPPGTRLRRRTAAHEESLLQLHGKVLKFVPETQRNRPRRHVGWAKAAGRAHHIDALRFAHPAKRLRCRIGRAQANPSQPAPQARLDDSGVALSRRMSLSSAISRRSACISACTSLSMWSRACSATATVCSCSSPRRSASR